MAKKKASARKPDWMNPNLSPLEAVMEWAFEQHHAKELTSKLNLDRLLEKAAIDPKLVIGVIPIKIRKRLSKHEKQVIIEAFTTRGYRNALVHGRKVLRFMAHLFHHKSLVPPPWKT